MLHCAVLPWWGIQLCSRVQQYGAMVLPARESGRFSEASLKELGLAWGQRTSQIQEGGCYPRENWNGVSVVRVSLEGHLAGELCQNTLRGDWRDLLFCRFGGRKKAWKFCSFTSISSLPFPQKRKVNFQGSWISTIWQPFVGLSKGLTEAFRIKTKLVVISASPSQSVFKSMTNGFFFLFLYLPYHHGGNNVAVKIGVEFSFY